MTDLNLVEFYRLLFGDFYEDCPNDYSVPRYGKLHYYPVICKEKRLDEKEKHFKVKASLATPRVLATLETRRIKEGSLGTGYYACVSTLSGDGLTKSGYIPRTKENCISAHLIMLDDLGTKNTREPPVKPTLKIETSKGNFQYIYRLKPYDVSDEEGLEHYEACLRGLVAAGYGDEACVDAVRVFRVPGSVNTKPERNGFISYVAAQNNIGKAWDLDEFMQAMEVKPQYERKNKPHALIDTKNFKIDDNYNNRLLTFLIKNNCVLENKVNERGYIPIKCPWASEHTDPNDVEAGYSPPGFGPYPHQHNFKCFHSHGRRKKTAQFIAWANDNRASDEEEFKKEAWEAVAVRLPFDGGKFGLLDPELKTEKQAVKKPGEFATLYGIELARANNILRSNMLPLAKDIIYHPGQKVFYKNVHKEGVYNLWRPSIYENMKDDGGDATLFWDLIDHLLHPEDIELFIDWLAHLIQKPDDRGFAYLIIGEKGGEGKGMLGSILKTLLGLGNVNEATIGQICNADGWADAYAFFRLVIINELKNLENPSQRFSIYERLKEIIEDTVKTSYANLKGRGYDYILNFAMFLIFSNHNDPIKIDPRDRRLCVIKTRAEALPPELAKRIAQELLNPLSMEWVRAYNTLKERQYEVEKVHTPPMTEAKRDLLDAVETSEEEEVHKHIKALPGDLISSKMLQDYIDKALHTANDTHNRRDHIRSIVRTYWSTLADRETQGTVYRRLRAVRNYDKWRIGNGSSKKSRDMEAEKNLPTTASGSIVPSEKLAEKRKERRNKGK